MPNDPTLHEFRALALFALGRYDEAAAALYAVLSVGPGWDWSTLISLYGNPETYTQQLRALESYVDPESEFGGGPLRPRLPLPDPRATPRRLPISSRRSWPCSPRISSRRSSSSSSSSPQDSSASGNRASPGGTNRSCPGRPPPPRAPTARDRKASSRAPGRPSPRKDTTITVTFQDQGHFTWKVAHQGQDHQFQGESSYVNGILTLAQDQNNAMVGDVNWQDPNHFQFKVLGGGPSDPGLTFAKSS